MKFKAFRTFEEEKKFVNRIVELETPLLEEGKVLIKVAYSSLNYKDALSSIGNKGVTRNYPHTPGIDASGEVIESKSKKLNVGDKVLVTGYDLGMNTDGGFGEIICVPDSWVVNLPKDLSLKEAMCYGTAGFTAALCVYDINRKMDTAAGKILVTGSGGGVGSFAVKFLAKLGYEVIALSRGTGNIDFLKSIGATEVMTFEEFESMPDRPLGKPQWAGAVDTLGGGTLGKVLSLTEYGGVVTCCGNVLGGDLNTTVYPFILRGISLVGIDSANAHSAFREKIWQLMTYDYRPDKDILVEGIFEISMDELEENLKKMLTGESRGRKILKY